MIISRSIHVSANDNISFFFMSEQHFSVCVCVCVCFGLYIYIDTHTYVCVSIYICVCIHSPVDGHLGCFQIHTEVHVSFQIRFYIFSGYMPMVGLLDLYSNSIFGV